MMQKITVIIKHNNKKCLSIRRIPFAILQYYHILYILVFIIIKRLRSEVHLHYYNSLDTNRRMC